MPTVKFDVTVTVAGPYSSRSLVNGAMTHLQRLPGQMIGENGVILSIVKSDFNEVVMPEPDAPQQADGYRPPSSQGDLDRALSLISAGVEALTERVEKLEAEHNDDAITITRVGQVTSIAIRHKD